MMNNNQDILREAQRVIREHEGRAPQEAIRMVDEMIHRGDLEGQRTWRRVLHAIDLLQVPPQADGQPKH